jgi:broad specificity phosphatase PhoE/predicted nucleotidyltransferase component of viral defense system
MSIEKLKNKIKSYATENNLTVQEAWDKYFFDSLLIKLSLSNYKDNFVLKGGFLLENIIGIQNRTTLDIDFSYRLNDISEEVLSKKISAVLKIKTKDEVLLELRDIEPINKEEKYDGYRVRINATIGNVKKIFSIDIATGDVITPEPKQLNYVTNITQEIITINSYNIETILAEKFQTVIERGTDNTRMKDFYDIYMLINHKELDKEMFHDVIINTFEARKTNIKKLNIESRINQVLNSNLIENMFVKYASKNSFVKDITFDQVRKAVVETKNLIKYQEEFTPAIKSLILIRHGEDETNKIGGWSDNKLTSKGIEQVKELKDNLSEILPKSENFIILSSDLTRAKESAMILFGESYNIIYDYRLRECNNGDLANLTKEEFNIKYPGLYFASLDLNEHYPNGESPQDFYNRVSNLFIELNNKYTNQNLIVVTHGGVYGVLKSMINGIIWSNKQKYLLGFAKYYIHHEK